MGASREPPYASGRAPARLKSTGVCQRENRAGSGRQRGTSSEPSERRYRARDRSARDLPKAPENQTPTPMDSQTSHRWPSWLAFFGLACLASTLLRRVRPLPLPERLGRCADDLQFQIYR